MSVATITLIAWIPLSAALFGVFRPARAITIAYLVGWLYLPAVRVPIEGFWDLDKTLAANTGVLLGILLCCPSRILSYRLHFTDVLLLCFCGVVGLSSVLNNLGFYDAFSRTVHVFMFFGVPFVFGRMCLRDYSDLQDAARAIVTGAALYAILAICEWRISPQFHRLVYGVHQHHLITLRRWGFFRPVVFFPMTLGLGTFFAWTALLGWWLWCSARRHQRERHLHVVIAGAPIIGLLVTMSFGPYALFALGLCVLALCIRSRRPWALLIGPAFAAVWMAGRYTGTTDGAWLNTAVESVSVERAASLAYRIDAETLLLARAKQRPWFGWGGWGRHRVVDAHGQDLAMTDGLWIFLVGVYGLAGLALFLCWWCSPLIMGINAPRVISLRPVLLVIMIAIGLQTVNFLFNAFLSPILTMLCGGFVSVVRKPPKDGASSRRTHISLHRGHSPPLPPACPTAVREHRRPDRQR